MIRWQTFLGITKYSCSGSFRKNSRELDKIIFPRTQAYNFTKDGLEYGGLFPEGFKIPKSSQNLNLLIQHLKEKVINASIQKVINVPIFFPE